MEKRKFWAALPSEDCDEYRYEAQSAGMGRKDPNVTTPSEPPSRDHTAREAAARNHWHVFRLIDQTTDVLLALLPFLEEYHKVPRSSQIMALRAVASSFSRWLSRVVDLGALSGRYQPQHAGWAAIPHPRGYPL